MKRFAIIAAACLIAAPVGAKTIASVNGQDISQKDLDNFVELLVSQGADESDELREQVKQEMINRLVAVQAAEEAGIDKSEAVEQEIKLARQGILVRALMNDYLEKHPVSDDDIQAEYDQFKSQQSEEREYKVRHILVKEEDEAKQLIADIKADKTSFEDAAENESIDPGSGQKGGDLGWAPASNYVPEFAEAVTEMDKGSMTDEPVKSQFGWHVIQVEDSRSVELPELDQLKPQIEEQLRQKALADYQQELLENADIEEN